MSKPKKSLSFFITINKQTDEFILQEGTLLSLKIPKNWQKPHASVKSPALWVCHLPTNSLEIVFISLYPTELVIKKEGLESPAEEATEYGGSVKSKKQLEESFLTYKGVLEPNGETEKETFFRCRLKLQKKKKEVAQISESSGAGTGVAVFFIIVFVVLIAIGVSGGFK